MKVCIPEPISNLKCKHGNYYDSSSDPVVQDWIQEADATLYLPDQIRPVDVYYRPVIGKKCKCKQYYQWARHFIFNYNNKYLITYRLLTQFQTLFLQTECTLDSITKSYSLNNSILGIGKFINRTVFTNMICAYLRLLDMEVQKVFICDSCLAAKKMIIHIDGIQLGTSA